MKALFTTSRRYLIIVVCLLVGTVTGSFIIKHVSAATAASRTPTAQNFLFLPLVLQNTTVVNHANFTLTPGKLFFYEGITPDGAAEKVQVEVTQDQKTILGVATVVVRDREWDAGVLVEDTYDWYTQDSKGNVWYYGEHTDNYENGVIVNHDGSWEAGVNGAEQGIIMEANPQAGDTYRQEYLKGTAEDQAQVLSTTASVTTKFGSFKNCVETKDFTRLEPGVVEDKYYCKEVGNLVFSKSVAGETGQSELVNVQTP